MTVIQKNKITENSVGHPKSNRDKPNRRNLHNKPQSTKFKQALETEKKEFKSDIYTSTI